MQRHATSCSLLPTLCRHHWSENPGLWTGLRLSQWQAACSTSNADLPKTWSDYTLAPLVSTCVPEVGAGLALHMLMWQLMDVMTQGCIMTARRRLRCTSRARWRCCAVLGLCLHTTQQIEPFRYSFCCCNQFSCPEPSTGYHIHIRGKETKRCDTHHTFRCR